MATTLFTDGVTLTAAAWFNDVDTSTYPLTAVGGTGNAITATGPSSMTAYGIGKKIWFTPTATNSGATAINISSIGSRNIFNKGAACVGGEIVSGTPTLLYDDGTRFHIIGPTNLAATVSSGSVVQCRTTTLVTSGTGATAWVFDDTIPQSGEGNEVMQASAFTPQYANSTLLIIGKFFGGENSSLSTAGIGAGIWRDSDAGALVAESTAFTPNDRMGTSIDHAALTLITTVSAGSTSATTFKMRAGVFDGGNGASIRWNGLNGSRVYGGVNTCSITIMEIKA